MAHQAQMEFCAKIKNLLPEYFDNIKVLDVGSLDVNGNNRHLFTNCEYIGCDLAPGENVDIISEGHNLHYNIATFDTIISTECFEHDMFYELTVKNIIRMLKPEGLFLFTCATTGRREHGTMQNDRYCAPLLTGEWAHYYKNLTKDDFTKIENFKDAFKELIFYINYEAHDLYFYGIKK